MTLCILCPAFDRVPRRDIISWFFPRCVRRKGHKWQPSLGWLVCVQFAAPRRIDDLVTNMPVLISIDVATQGVRVTCADDPCLALRSRPAFDMIGVTVSAQEICPLAPSFPRWCDNCLEQRARVLLGSKDDKQSRWALALHGARERPRPIGSRDTLHCPGTEVPCLDSQPWLSSPETLLANRRSAKVSCVLPKRPL